ncbi:MAG: hypothetical protein O2865_13675, partial [Planctomycetota bacterium]|nr:hypothetical protein [Planctomycetota bacterium]
MHWVQFRFTRAAVAALAVVAPTADHVPTDPGPGRLQLPAPRVVVEVEPRARAASPRPLILALGQSNLDAAFCDLDPSRVQEGSGKQQRRIWNPFSGSWEPLDPWRKNNATRFLLGPGLPGIPSQRLVGRPKACPMLRFMSLLQAEEPLRGSSTTYLVKACATGTYMFDWTGEQNLEWVSWNHLPAVPVIGRHLYPTLLYDLATARSASREPLR